MDSAKSRRLASLDILRGLDLFLLLLLQPVIVAVGGCFDAPWLDNILYQLDHEVWEGFRLWDIVMPLFLFMVGTSMPFSFAKYRNEPSRKKIYTKILRRFMLLFLFGMIVQGNLLAFDTDRLYIYNNTLQAIAVGYLIAALILLHLDTAWQIATTLLLMAIYSLPMLLNGDYTPEGNFAFTVDRAVIGSYRGDLTYTWVWSSLTLGATVMMGVLAGRIIKEGGKNRSGTTYILLAIGVALILTGLLAGQWEPIIKRLWTSSMTMFSGGICYILMALFYWWIDVRGHSRGLGWLKVYGMNPITAYVVGEVINFRSIVASVSYGLEPVIGECLYGAWLTLGNGLILLGILTYMYRQKIFLKI